MLGWVHTVNINNGDIYQAHPEKRRLRLLRKKQERLTIMPKNVRQVFQIGVILDSITESFLGVFFWRI